MSHTLSPPETSLALPPEPRLPQGQLATDLDVVDRIVARTGGDAEAVIPILQALQQHFRYLPPSALERVCQLTRITPQAIAGVSTFYTHFRHRPLGRHLVSVCQGTACHVKGAARVRDSLGQQLQIPEHEDTDPSGRFTVQPVACLGCCTLGPVVEIDGETFGHVTPQSVPEMLREFLQERAAAPVRSRPQAAASRTGKRDQDWEIRVGLGSCCVAQGSGRVHDALCSVVAADGACATVKRVGCSGMCHQTPLVELVAPDGSVATYAHVRPDAVTDIVRRHLPPRGWIPRMQRRLAGWLDRWYSDEPPDSATGMRLDTSQQQVCAFLGPQQRLTTDLCQQIDPLDLDEYLRHDGFVALKQCAAEQPPEDIIRQIELSGLRGRGGAGFPSFRKWAIVRRADSPEKYVICNGDEGDPGAFMDRMLLESVPYRVIEGLAIAALAVGARRGIFYIRAEYPLAVQRIREAIQRCVARNLLGDRVAGTCHALHFEVREGAGAFICGEETALIHSLEGGRGTPRLRPPFPAESGLHGRPTLINNVETLAAVPWIIRQGGENFARIGTETSKGTKVFALAGKIVRGGLIEVPMGVTIRQIVEDIGGGVPPGRTFKAVQIGGPSGGCVPAALADTPVDYESLTRVGAIMGSGGLVVLDDSDCMVDIARYFLRFTQDQSCGKCTYCRVGTKRMLEILDRLCQGKGRRSDLDQLEQLAAGVASGSLCGLGKTAPTPVLTTLRYFRDEYEAHLEGRCPAGKCVELIRYHIDDRCIGCTICAQHCPVDAIPADPYRRHAVRDELCTRCDTCRVVCPENAVQVVSPRTAGQDRRTGMTS